MSSSDFDAYVSPDAPDPYYPNEAYIDLDRSRATGEVKPHLCKYGKEIAQPIDDCVLICGGGKVRMQVLGNGIVRVEYDGDGGGWEDRATFVVVDRGGGKEVIKDVKKESNGIVVGSLSVKLKDNAKGEGLSGRLVIDSDDVGKIVYDREEDDKLVLGGCCRTLDEADGYYKKRENKIIMQVPLTTSVVSRRGVTLIDDSQSPVFDESGWFAPRSEERRLAYEDVYVLIYGKDYQKALRQYAAIAGGVPLIPRGYLGNWWSRYWSYTDKEFLEVADNFEKLDVPLSVMIIDMDWHITNYKGQYHWTGYTWNRDLFPNPNQFISELHDRGLLTSMNLHPAAGVKPYEAVYHDYANFIGAQRHAKENKNLPFDLTDPLQASAYFETLLHPHEKMGQPQKSFWWIDWQQGTKSRITGVDPLFQLNHLHFLDLSRDGLKRSAVFSRYSGRGGHRYPIGFSGDTHITWESLAFQVFLTASSACCAYFWNSHDIGGHFGGLEHPDLYLRWVQWGILSPIMRLHSNCNPFHKRAPYAWDKETCYHASEAMKFRHQLIPYLYSAVYRATTNTIPPLAPMYFKYPNEELAYNVPGQYLLGESLVCAPIVTPCSLETQLSRQVIWLPLVKNLQSTGVPYRHFWSGEAMYPGLHAVHGGKDFIPLYLKPGGIVVLSDKVTGSGLQLNSVDPPKSLITVIAAGADGVFDLFEDDENRAGSSTFLTRISFAWRSDTATVTIGAVRKVQKDTDTTEKCTSQGDLESTIPAQRKWTIRIIGVVPLNTESGEEVSYDRDTESCTFVVDQVDAIKGACLRFTRKEGGSERKRAVPRNLLSSRNRTEEKIEAMLRAFRLGNVRKQNLSDSVSEMATDPTFLTATQEENYGDLDTLKPAMKRALFEVIWNGGVERAWRSCPNAPFVAWEGRQGCLPIKVGGKRISGTCVRPVGGAGGTDGSDVVLEVEYGGVVCGLKIPLGEKSQDHEQFDADLIKITE